MADIRLVSGFVTVGAWTLGSRVFGFMRDILIAAYLGSGPIAEAFLVALTLPNMFRNFFAEGAFNMAFVPMFAKKLEGDEGAQAFARDAFSGLAAVLIGLTLVAQALMPWLVLAMAAGFDGDERFGLAVHYGRITFVYIVFISLAALVSGVLNAAGRFTATAAAPLLMNLLFIASMLAADRLGWDFGRALAWTVPVAGVAQLALVWITAARAGFVLVPRRPRLTPDLRRLARIALPAVLAGGVVQINLLVGRQVASVFDGAIAWLSFADRLYQLPLGVVGIAIGIVLLPDLSRRIRAGDHAGGQASFNRAAEFALALALPSAVALVVIAEPLVRVLYQRGAFDASDTAATAIAVAVYGVGLPGFVLQKVMQPLFFARENTRSPFRYALVSLVVNGGMAVALSPVIGFAAAALGTTLAGWSMVLQLWFGSRAMGDAVVLDARLRDRAWRIAAAALGMGACLWGAAQALEPLLEMGRLRYLALVLLVSLGIASYAALGLALGAFRVADLRGAVRR